MNLKIISIIITLFVFQFAYAEEMQVAYITKFDQLKASYDQGQPPVQEEMAGGWSGRCYKYNDKNTATNIILLANTVVHAPGNGSADPVKTTFNFGFLWYNSGHGFGIPADWFDNLTDTTRMDIENTLKSYEHSILISSYENNALISNKNGQTGGDLMYLVRKYEDYFVGLMIQNQDSGGLKKGDLFKTCYFFKKVMDLK